MKYDFMVENIFKLAYNNLHEVWLWKYSNSVWLYSILTYVHIHVLYMHMYMESYKHLPIS